MSKIDVTAAELRALAERARGIGTLEAFTDVALQWAGLAEKEIERLRRQLDEAERDAERYRWLRTQPNDTSAPRIDVVHWTPSDESSNEGEGLRLDALDAAIDAAMDLTRPAERD